MDKCDLFRYYYKLSIIEDVYNVFKKQWSFAMRGVVRADPPPQLWSTTIFLPFFLHFHKHNYFWCYGVLFYFQISVDCTFKVGHGFMCFFIKSLRHGYEL